MSSICGVTYSYKNSHRVSVLQTNTDENCSKSFRGTRSRVFWIIINVAYIRLLSRIPKIHNPVLLNEMRASEKLNKLFFCLERIIHRTNLEASKDTFVTSLQNNCKHHCPQIGYFC